MKKIIIFLSVLLLIFNLLSAQEIKHDEKTYNCIILKTYTQTVSSYLCYITILQVGDLGNYKLIIYKQRDLITNISFLPENYTGGYCGMVYYDSGNDPYIEDEGDDVVSATSTRGFRITEVNGFYRVLILTYGESTIHRVNFVYKSVVKEQHKKK